MQTHTHTHIQCNAILTLHIAYNILYKIFYRLHPMKLVNVSYSSTINTPLNINKFTFKYLVTTIRIKTPIYNSNENKISIMGSWACVGIEKRSRAEQSRGQVVREHN